MKNKDRFKEGVYAFISGALLGLVMMIIVLCISLISQCAHANSWPKNLDITEFVNKITHADLVNDEPSIDILSGSDRNTSVIVVTWPDGVVDRLVYNNKDSGKFNKFREWIEDRAEAYEKRKKKSVFF